MQDTFLKKDIILLKKYVQILLKWYWFGGIRALALLNIVLDQGLKYRYRVKNRSPSVWPVTVKAGKIGQNQSEFKFWILEAGNRYTGRYYWFTDRYDQ
jgi:hypothetical protein